MSILRTQLAALATLGVVASPAASQYAPQSQPYQQYPQSYPQAPQSQSYQQYPQAYPQAPQSPSYQQYSQDPRYQQTYPQGTYQGNGYNEQYGSDRRSGNAVTDIIDSLLGNQYSVSDRQAVRQCASAAMAQAGQQYGGYGYQRGGMRVTSITGVERRGSYLRVSGMMSAGGRYANGYGNRYGYQSPANGAGSVSFRCNVAYNGAVTGVRIGRPY